MKKLLLLLMAAVLTACPASAQGTKLKVILLISEQNIGVVQRAWWAGEVDLSATEAAIAQKLIEAGYEVVDPASVAKVIRQDKAFRVVTIPEAQTVTLAKAGGAGYIVAGKAVASAGQNVPQSNMRSYYATITAKLIRAKDGKVLAYLTEQGSSAHMEAVMGGTEALNTAAQKLAQQILQAVAKDAQAVRQ